ncbi:MAG: DUF1573 domain-containing protein [Cryomorphaceae bacterium]|nr:MAG: DUF1573 domain-containing protein [Cryomorphaceae bacterium]
MKKALFILGIFLTAAVGLQAQAVNAGPVIEFDKEVHDYGEIEQHGNGVCEFTLTNTGNEPLIISQAKGSCGCTVPSYDKEPIMPGATSVIKVKYDTKRVGPINKAVTITSNATNAPSKVLRIKGTVLAAESGATSPVMERSAVAPVAE